MPEDLSNDRTRINSVRGERVHDAPPQIPDHELIRPIGRGAFKQIWLARTIIGQYRAVAVVSRNMSRHLEKEFAGLRKFEPISRSHHGFVGILHVGRTEQGDLYYVMQLADDQRLARDIQPESYTARTLRTEIGNRGRFSLEECLRVGLALAEALEYLHGQGFVHRDIKPDNILYVEGLPTLGDIGLVADIGQESFVGTPGYIPPEGPGDPQADLYSLGKVLYEISTGKDRESFPELPPESPQTPTSEKLRQFHNVIVKACANDVRKRYQTAQGMRADLTRLQQGQRVELRETPPNNLPAPVTSFIGREKELAEVKELLKTTRLLTLTGIGGTGKTRLSLQVALDMLRGFPDGVWFVELGALTDAALVPQAIASAVGTREEPNRDLRATLIDHLQEKQLLVVLDNCEHLLQGCAQIAEDLLRGCLQVQILATSREGLRIAGEVSWPVPSLSLPVESDLVPTVAQSESARLFAQRAAAANPGFAVTEQNARAVAKICRRLDGIPLAIELAAARAKTLSAEQIAQRLDDRFRLLTGGSRTALPRHQTLRALLDWSYNLLADNERMLLRRLSVFSDGWTLEAAEVVCATQGIAGHEVLDLLTYLVDKSLVLCEHRGGTARYRLLETVRQYARDKLLESDEGEWLRRRRLDYFVKLTEEAEPQLTGAEQAVWLERLEQEHDNLRAALGWSQSSTSLEVPRPSEAGLRIAGALWRFWSMRGYVSEGHEWLTKGIECYRSTTAGPASSGDKPGLSTLAKALNGAGVMAMGNGGCAAARTLFEESLALRRQLGEKRGVALSLNNLGIVAQEQGDYRAMQALFEECLTIMRELGDKWGIALALDNLGTGLCCQGDYGPARARHEESLALLRELENKWGTALALSNLGNVVCRQRDYAAARQLQEDSLSISREIGDESLMGNALGGLGQIAYQQGEWARACAFQRERLTIAQRLGDKRDIAVSLLGLAKVASGQGRSERAARQFGAAESLRETIGVHIPPADRGDHDHDVAAVRAALGEKAFTSAWAVGRGMMMNHAITFALDDTLTA